MAGRRRTKWIEEPYDPAAVMRMLRICRAGLLLHSRPVKPNGVYYRATRAATAAIDDLAFLLTGERGYFWDQGTSGGGRLGSIKDKMAREAGETPWVRLEPDQAES